MVIVKSTTVWAVLFFLGYCSIVKGEDSSKSLPQMSLSIHRQEICMGEPLVIEVSYLYEHPRTGADSNVIYPRIKHDAVIVVHEQGGNAENCQLLPSLLSLAEPDGALYKQRFIVWYDVDRESLVFRHPGTYTVQVCRSKAETSNSVTVSVTEATLLQKRAMALLVTPSELSLMQYGVVEHDNTRALALVRLQSVVDEAGATLLGMWAAARIGLEEQEELERTHPEYRGSIAGEPPGDISDERLNTIRDYLQRGMALPDEFPLREEVVYSLSRNAWARRDEEGRISALAELDVKYPNGEFAALADRLRTPAPKEGDVNDR